MICSVFAVGMGASVLGISVKKGFTTVDEAIGRPQIFGLSSKRSFKKIGQSEIGEHFFSLFLVPISCHTLRLMHVCDFHSACFYLRGLVSLGARQVYMYVSYAPYTLHSLWGSPETLKHATAGQRCTEIIKYICGWCVGTFEYCVYRCVVDDFKR